MPDNLHNLLSVFISFPSVSGQSKPITECLHWIEAAFLTHDTTVHHGVAANAPYLYVKHPNPKLLLFAHIDVVPANPDQWELRVEGDRAYGRGTKDMKGAALPFLMAYSQLRNEGLHPPVNLLFSSDEEIGGASIPIIIEEEKIDVPVALTPDTGSYDWIVYAHKGGVKARLTAEGHAGHAAMPWTTDNPIWRLAEAITSLKKDFHGKEENNWTLTVTPTILSGGEVVNQVPDRVSCDLDIRFPPDECATVEEVLERLNPLLPPKCHITTGIPRVPLNTDPDHPMIKRVRNIATEVYGKDVGLGREPGATDARYFSNRGIPAFLYGPYGEELHGANEWVSLDSINKHYEVMLALLRQLCDEEAK